MTSFELEDSPLSPPEEEMDEGLPFITVTGRPFKRPRPDLPSLEVANRFTPLADPRVKGKDQEAAKNDTDNTETGTSATKKEPKPPPIVITTPIVSNSLKMLLLTNEMTGFSIRQNLKISKETKLFMATKADHATAVEILDKTNTEFYTYRSRKDVKKHKRFLVHGLDLDHPDKDIADDLAKKIGGALIKAHRLNKTNPDGTKSRMPPFLLITEAKVTLADLQKIKAVDYIKVKIEPFKNRGDPIQCHNCQQFGHAARNCYSHGRCTKCGEVHPPNESCSTPEAAPKCLNCGGEHVAAWRGCPKRQQLIDKIKTAAIERAAERIEYHGQKEDRQAGDHQQRKDPIHTTEESYANALRGLTCRCNQQAAEASTPPWFDQLFTMMTALMTTMNEVLKNISKNGK